MHGMTRVDVHVYVANPGLVYTTKIHLYGGTALRPNLLGKLYWGKLKQGRRKSYIREITAPIYMYMCVCTYVCR